MIGIEAHHLFVMPRTSGAKTRFALLPGHDEFAGSVRTHRLRKPNTIG
jgi:hypothetical protein